MVAFGYALVIAHEAAGVIGMNVRKENVRHVARPEPCFPQTGDEFATVTWAQETTGSRVDEDDAIAEREHPLVDREFDWIREVVFGQ